MILKDFVTLSEDCVPSATCNLTGSLSQDFLSQHDLNLLGVGYFGCMCVYKESINALLLKESLGAALSFMPWLAGRLTRKGNAVDIDPNNKGARLVLSSCSSTLDEVLAAVRQGLQDSGAGGRAAQGVTSGAHNISNPIPHLFCPNALEEQFKQDVPLLLGCLVHLRGGGALLLVVLHHGVGDFGSLQVAAAHWAAAYNAALGIREQRIAADLDSSKRQAAKDSGPCSIRPSHPTAVEIAAAMQGPAGLSPPVQATHVLESYAAKGDDLVPQSQLARDTLLLMHDSQAMKIIVQRMMHHTVWRGGGTESRRIRVSAARLAELKAQAMQELAQERAALKQMPSAPGHTQHQHQHQQLLQPAEAAAPHHHAGAEAAARSSSISTSAASCSLKGPVSGAGPSASASAPETSAEELRALLADVEWVSTNDALVARIMQVLHSVPLRQHSSTSFNVAVDVRPRMTPPLGLNTMGNAVKDVVLRYVRPSQLSLGLLAGSIRSKILKRAAHNYACTVAHSAALRAGGVAADGLMFDTMIGADLRDCMLVPEGLILASNWDVDYNCWKFGAGYPLELMTPYTLASTPNALVLTPSPPSATTTPPAATTTAGHPAPGVAQAADEGAAPARAGGHVKSAGMDVQLCLHVKTWQQLDAQGGLRI